MVRCLDLSRGCSHPHHSVRAAVSGLSTTVSRQLADGQVVITSRSMHRARHYGGRGMGRAGPSAGRRRLAAASRLRAATGGSSPTGRSRTDALPRRTTRCASARRKGCAHDPQASGRDSPSCDGVAVWAERSTWSRIAPKQLCNGIGELGEAQFAQKFWGMYRTGGAAQDRTRLWAACSSLWWRSL